MIIKSLTNDQPHPDYKGWQGFIDTCELRDEYNGVKYYGSSNCNYIVFPCGTLIQNFGYHGKNLMNKVRELGAQETLKNIRDKYNEFQNLLYGKN